MAGRPPTYASDDERPVNVSLRIPKGLYDQAHQYAGQHRMTLTEMLLDGLKLRLETPTDPRELFLFDQCNTVMQELQAMVTATVQAELAKLLNMALPPPTHDTQPTNNDILYDRGNTVLQEEASDELEQSRQLGHAMLARAREIVTDTTEQATLLPSPQNQRTRPVRDRTMPASRGLPQEILQAIADEHVQCPGLTIRDFAQHLYDKGIYRAKGDKPAEAGWLHRKLVEARATGLL